MSQTIQPSETICEILTIIFTLIFPNLFSSLRHVNTQLPVRYVDSIANPAPTNVIVKTKTKNVWKNTTKTVTGHKTSIKHHTGTTHIYIPISATTTQNITSISTIPSTTIYTSVVPATTTGIVTTTFTNFETLTVTTTGAYVIHA